MYVWWHNGGVRLDPETNEERAALLVLAQGTKYALPPEMRPRPKEEGDGVQTGCVVGVAGR